ncbi:uncharacterized protein DAT39_012003, partial [Clarias magur]
SSQFVWSKNNEQLNTSGPVLHFPALTVRDSGSYTCTWKTNEMSGSKTISLQVEGDNPGRLPVWIIAVVTVGVIVIILVILGAGVYIRRKKDDAPEDNIIKAGEQTEVKSTPQPKEVSQQEDVAYASVCIKDNNLNNCSSQFVWSKNNEQFNTSGPVLHFPALTVRDSGSYTCTWKTNETSGSKTISLQVEGDFTQWKIWIIVLMIVVVIVIVAAGVSYWRERGKAPNLQNCGKSTEKAWAEEHTMFKVTMPELNHYPQLGEETSYKEEVTYASVCIKAKEQKPGSSNTTSDFEYVGDDKSNCTLLIHNVQFSYSGEYRFRFITNVDKGKWTGDPGVTLQTAGDRLPVWIIAVVTVGVIVIILVILGAGVYNRRKKDDAAEDNIVKAQEQTEVKSAPQPKEVSQQEEVAYASVCIKDNNLNNGLSGDGTLKQGDSLNLTCDVNCTHSSSQFVWSKNNEQFNTSGPVLHFPALTVRDSGNYTCTWETNETSGSKTISLQVEGETQQTVWIIVLVTIGIILILVTGAVIYNR